MMTMVLADYGLTYRLSDDGEGWELLCLPNPACEIQPETGRIVSVAYDERIEKTPADAEFIRILTPGLINGHTHLELNPTAPIFLAEGESMADWLIRVASHYRDRNESERLSDAISAAKELLSTGCTAVNDVSTAGASMEALRQTGLRGRVGIEFFHPSQALNTAVIQRVCDTLLELEHAVGDCPWVELGLSPHSPYNVSINSIIAVIQSCKELPVQIHVAESADEIAWFRGEDSGINTLHQRFLGQIFHPAEGIKTPFDSVYSVASLFEEAPWVMVHGNYLTRDNFNAMAECGLSLVHCPVSNHVLRHPALNLDDVEDAGVAWCFGTDGRVSNPQLDLRAEARLAMSRGLSAEAAFLALTAGAADALGFERIGELSPGFFADMVLWQAPKRPNASPLDLLLDSETRVEAVWVAGQKRL